MIKTIFFDLMDTLVHLPSKPKHLVHKFLEFSGAEEFDDCAREVTIRHPGLSERRFFEELYRARGMPIDRLAIDTAIRVWDQSLDKAKLFPGFSQTMESLLSKGFDLSIISNSYPPTYRLLEKFGFYRKFQHIILSCDMGSWKPSLGIFERALSVAKASPSTSCMVGNRLTTDVVGALDAGIMPILLRPHASRMRDVTVQGVAVHAIVSLTDLPELLTQERLRKAEIPPAQQRSRR